MFAIFQTYQKVFPMRDMQSLHFLVVPIYVPTLLEVCDLLLLVAKLRSKSFISASSFFSSTLFSLSFLLCSVKSQSQYQYQYLLIFLILSLWVYIDSYKLCILTNSNLQLVPNTVLLDLIVEKHNKDTLCFSHPIQ